MKGLITGLAIIWCFAMHAQTEIINKTNLYTGQQEQLEVLKDGLISYTRFYANGMVEESGFLLNGEKHGLWQKFEINGHKHAAMSFNQGIKEGLKYVWNSDGHLIFKVKYEDNRVVEAIHYSDNGSIIASR